VPNFAVSPFATIALFCIIACILVIIIMFGCSFCPPEVQNYFAVRQHTHTCTQCCFSRHLNRAQHLMFHIHHLMITQPFNNILIIENHESWELETREINLMPWLLNHCHRCRIYFVIIFILFAGHSSTETKSRSKYCTTTTATNSACCW
jgi:hypothetical protein